MIQKEWVINHFLLQSDLCENIELVFFFLNESATFTK